MTVFDAGITDMTERRAAARRAPGRHQARRARPRRRRSPRRGAGARRARLLPSGRARGGRVGRPLPPTTGTSTSSPATAALVYPRLLPHWDGGAVQIAGTVEEGDEVAGFRVIELPGHAPGPDRAVPRVRPAGAGLGLLLHLDPQTGIKGAAARARTRPSTSTPSRPARRSASSPRSTRRSAWAGHAEPVRGDVVAQLEHAADPPTCTVGRAQPPAPPAREARRPPHRRSTRRRGQRADAPRLADPGGSPRVRRDAAPAASTARTPGSGRSSCCSSAWRCRGRSPGSDRAARRSCSARYRMATAGRAPVRPRRAARARDRALPGARRRRDRPRRVRGAAVRLVPGGRGRASRCWSPPPRWPSRCIAPLHRAVLERGAWPLLRLSPPRAGRGFYRHASEAAARRVRAARADRGAGSRRAPADRRARPTPARWPASIRR